MGLCLKKRICKWWLLGNEWRTYRKISDFQVRIEPTTSKTPERSNLWVRGTPCELSRLTGFLFTQSVPLAMRARWCEFHSTWCMKYEMTLNVAVDEWCELWLLDNRWRHHWKDFRFPGRNGTFHYCLQPSPSKHHLHHSSTGAFNSIPSLIYHEEMVMVANASV